MKLTNSPLVVFFLLTSYAVLYPQSSKGQIPLDEKPQKKIKSISISDVYTQVGIYVQKDPMCTFADFQKLAPKSDLLTGDFNGYDFNSYYSVSANSLFSMTLGIKFSDKEKTSYRKNPQLRLGVNYFSTSSLSNYFSKYESKRYDTVLVTGEPPRYIDSVSSSNYSMNYISEQLQLDGSLIYRTDPAARWSLFAGIGITAGMSINAHTEIHHSSYSDPSYSSSSSYSYSYPSYSQNEYESETHRNKHNFGFSAFIPMGIDFRIGRKKEPWKRTHLFWELRPGVNSISIPELTTFTTTSMQCRLGIRVSVD